MALKENDGSVVKVRGSIALGDTVSIALDEAVEFTYLAVFGLSNRIKIKRTPTASFLNIYR